MPDIHCDPPAKKNVTGYKITGLPVGDVLAPPQEDGSLKYDIAPLNLPPTTYPLQISAVGIHGSSAPVSYDLVVELPDSPVNVVMGW